MALWVPCPQCDQHYQFPDAAAGKQASCPKCGKLLAVNAPAPQVPSVPRVPPLAPVRPTRVPAAPADEGEEPLGALPVPSQPGRPAPDDARRSPAPAPRLQPVEAPAEDLAPTAGDNPTAYYHAAC